MIQIPNPCKEDFSKMTPTQKGAYCSKCKHDTYDFRKMSQLEFAQTIQNHGEEQMCGQIYNTQLDDFNAGFIAWKKQNRRTFQSKFMMALLLVFGLSLFSCENEDEQLIESMTKMEIPSEINIDKRFVHEIQEIEELELVEMVEIMEEEVEFISCELTKHKILEEQIIDYPDREIYTTAGVMMDYGRPDILEYTEIVIADSIEFKIDEDDVVINHVDFEAKAFPNPTQFNSTLSFDVPSEGNYQVMMYDMNGRQVREIHNGTLLEGNQRFEIDMYDLNSGMFFVNIISEGNSETVKIQKVN
jgi:Secretion system C-terminal sorting domain